MDFSASQLCSFNVMVFKQKILLVLILAYCATSVAARDVASVFFEGDSTIMGMEVEGAYYAEGAFLVVTTGARFEYVPGELKIYQGLGTDIDSKRLVATLAIEDVGKYEKVEANDDHVLLWSENLNIGIYGDSTCVLAPKTELSVSFRGNFKPDYEGRHKGELLLIDDEGGIQIYPQRGNLLLYDKIYSETTYEIKKIELGRKDWLAEYVLAADERVVVAAFPGRPFDWEKSFKSNIAYARGSMGSGVASTYGDMPPDYVIRQWSQNLHIIFLTYQGLYKNLTAGDKVPWPGGPYIIANEPEFNRLVKTAHDNGMKVAPYCSLAYHYRKFKNIEPFYEQVKALRDKYGIDGVYIDGFGYDSIIRWGMIRRLRELFGSEGVLIYHGTGRGSPVATMPNLDTYCDIVIYGEGVPFKSKDDPYVRYQVRKYGISNTVGIWWDAWKLPWNGYDMIDAIIELNCRMLWGSPVKKHPVSQKDVWGTNIDGHLYYLKKLDQLKKSYYRKQAEVISNKGR